MPELTSLTELDTAPHAEVFETRRPRTVRLQLDAEERVPPHTHPGTNIVLHLLTGQLELTVGSDTYELNPEDLIRFSGDQEVSPYAIEASTAVIVFAPASDQDP